MLIAFSLNKKMYPSGIKLRGQTYNNSLQNKKNQTYTGCVYKPFNNSEGASHLKEPNTSYQHRPK